MQRENMRIATVFMLFSLLASLSFAANDCLSCFATNIGITEYNGTINVTLFQINRTTEITQGQSFFDTELGKYLTGQTSGTAIGTPTEATMSSLISTDATASPVKDADIYFYYSNRTGGKEDLIDPETGNKMCSPVKTSLTQIVSYTDGTTDPPTTKTATIYYGTCKVPYSLFKNTSITVIAEFRGDQLLKPSQKEITIYDISAGGLNVLASSLNTNLDFTNASCLAGLIILGLLFASMYFSGKSPLSYLDLTVPRIAKPKPYGFGPLIAGAGNIRLAMPTAWDTKFLDILIKKHGTIDFRGRLDKGIEAAIDASGKDAVRKYFAKLMALYGQNWRGFLDSEGDAAMLQAMRRAEKGEYGRLSHQLLMVMNQRIAAGKVTAGMVVVGGGQPQWLRKVTSFVRMVPMIGTYLTIATGSTTFGLRTAKEMAKGTVSAPLRKLMGEQYDALGRRVHEGESLTLINRKILEVASMTDANKMKVGKLFPLHEYAERFYKDARDSSYEEIVRNILWHELYQAIRKQAGADAEDIILSQMDFKRMFTDFRFQEALSRINWTEWNQEHAQLLKIVSNNAMSPREQAEHALALYGSRHGDFYRDARGLYNSLNEIETSPKYASMYDRADKLVRTLRDEYHIDQSEDISRKIATGNFFMTVGRNNLYYEENGEKKNFGFLTLGMREFTQQLAYLGMGKTAANPDQFTLGDSFKLAWLKISSQVFGHGEWYLDAGLDITTHNPVTGKAQRASFVKDVLGMSQEQLQGVNNTMKNYFYSLMSEEGRRTADQKAGAVNMGKNVVDNFLYGYDIKKTKEAEETRLWNRRQWYYMESESYPDEKYWRGNMNFMWSNKTGSADQRITLVHEMRGQKYWASMPRPEESWSLMENFMDGRLANILNGTQWDFFGQERQGQYFDKFSRVDMQKHFNETWAFYSKVREGLANFYQFKTGKEPASNLELENYLKDEKNRQITYGDLRNPKGTPFIYTHDYSYIPYVKGLPVSDFDRVINGVFVLQDDAHGTQRRMVDFNKINTKYNVEFQSAPECEQLRNTINSLRYLKKAPLVRDISSMEEQIRGHPLLSEAEKTQMINLLRPISALSGSKFSEDMNAYRRLVGEGMNASKSLREQLLSSSLNEAEKVRLLRAMDAIDVDRMPTRNLTHAELEQVRKVIFEDSKNVKAEYKLAFLKQFSSITHDWQSLWTDEKADFFTLTTTEQAQNLGQRGWVSRMLSNIVGAVVPAWESAVFAAGRKEAEAMSNNVPVSELYRERGHDMRMRIKTPGYLDEQLAREGYNAEDRDTLSKAYNNYSNSFQRFFVGWMDSVTRDPRGSSTQWGRQWYLQTMYHRGGAMHPESAEFGGERTFLSPAGWFLAQPLQRMASINWMFASPFVRLMRGFQTATYGYPTLWDKNVTAQGEFDLLQPWQHVNYTGWQKARALFNPAESVFSLGKFNLRQSAARSLQVIPGLNMLSYLFPSLEPSSQASANPNRFRDNIEKSSVYQALSRVPGLGSIMEQSQTQRSQRSGMDIVNALKQKPEDFLQYKGGGFVHHFTDSANPGVSYVDYTGRGRLAARAARYLASEMAGDESWSKFYGEDEYVRRQASMSMARRGIAAEAKRMHFQEELSGYSPKTNPMWAPLSVPTLAYWGYDWFKKSKLATGVAAVAGATAFGPAGLAAAAIPAAYQAYKYGKGKVEESERKRKAEEEAEEASRRGETPRQAATMLDATRKWAMKLKIDSHQCMFCGFDQGKGRVGRGGKCPNCGRYGG